jgi:phosphoglycerate dehydrogenase-like enzyme
MDVLTIEPLDSDVLAWLGARHAVKVAPELAGDTMAFRQTLARARAVIVPPTVAIDAAMLKRAPRLRIVGRLSVGAENIDLEACAQAGVEVVRPASASAPAEAEFVIAAVLQMLRRVPIISPEGLLVGRELNGCTVGVVGMTPAVRHLTPLLAAFGAQVLGYDPAVHVADPVWQRSGIEGVTLRELLRNSDAVCVLLNFFPRYVGLFGERALAECKRDQVLVSLAPSALFNDVALARTLREGPLAAAWFDNLEPALMEAGRPLCHVDTLQVTPRVSGTTQQSRKRSAWALAHRIDERLKETGRVGVRPAPTVAPGVPAGLGDDSLSA